MKNRELGLFLDDIIESINTIDSYVKGVTKREFLKNHLIQDAVLRRVEVVGEAVNNLPKSFQNKHPHIEWHKAVGMRNLLAHGYFVVNFGIVWDTIKKDFPGFRKKIENLLKLFHEA